MRSRKWRKLRKIPFTLQLRAVLSASTARRADGELTAFSSAKNFLERNFIPRQTDNLWQPLPVQPSRFAENGDGNASKLYTASNAKKEWENLYSFCFLLVPSKQKATTCVIVYSLLAINTYVPFLPTISQYFAIGRQINARPFRVSPLSFHHVCKNGSAKNKMLYTTKYVTKSLQYILWVYMFIHKYKRIKNWMQKFILKLIFQ